MKKTLALLLTVSSACALENFAFPKDKDINNEATKLVDECFKSTGFYASKDTPEYKEIWMLAAKKEHRKLLSSEMNRISRLITESSNLTAEFIAALESQINNAETAIKLLSQSGDHK